MNCKKNYSLMLIVFCAAFAFSFCPAQVSKADELLELKEQMKVTQEQIQTQLEHLQTQQKTIEAMQKRIELLEAEKAGKASSTVPAEGVPDWMNKIELGYKKGLYIKTTDDKHSLHIRFLFQPRYEFIDIDGGDDTSSFLIKRAQLRMFGNVFDPRLTYKFMIMGASSSSGEGDMNLRDAWINWKVSDYFQVRVGQHFVWYDYEDIQPSWALSLVDRSIINANLGFERDIGVRIHGKILIDRLSYNLYVMNGEGRNTLNANNELIYGSRFEYHILGSQQYIPSDLEYSEHPHLALGLAHQYDSGNASLNDNILNRFTTDLVFKYKGFSVLGLINLARNEKKNVTDTGYLCQVGYFLIPEKVEALGRWAKILKSGALGTDTVDPTEITFGFNYYIKGHNAKMSADYSRMLNNASTENRDDNRLRTQMQLFF